MALTKTFTAVTWASGSATASGTSNAVDISASYASDVNVQIVVVGTATTAASFIVEFSADTSNYRGAIGPFSAGTAAATYKFPPIQCPPGTSAVRIVYTAQSGGTSSTLTSDVSRTTAAMSVKFSANTMKLRRTASLPSNTTFTFAAWIYITTDTNTFQPFFYRTSNANIPFIYFGTDGTGTTLYTEYQQVSGGPDAGSHGSTTNMAVAKWYHVALVINDPSVKSYLNGRLEFSGARTSTLFPFNNDQITIGHDDDSDNDFFTGRMAAVKVWNAALSQAEIQQEMYSNAPVRSCGIYLWTPLNDITAIRDLSGQGHDWTASGSITTEADPAIYWSDPGMPWYVIENSLSAPGGGNTYSESGAFGLVIGEFSFPPVTFSPSPASGVVAGGFSFPPATFAPSPSDGIVLGALAAAPATYVPPQSAGTMIGSIASVPSTFAPSPSAGGMIGAVAAVPATFAPTPASGVVAGGMATTPATYAAIASAGVVPGAAASSPASYVASGASGVVPGGVAASPASYAESGSSGAVMGSVAATVATFATAGASGVSIGTATTDGSTFTDSGFAGIVVGSIADVPATYATPSSSGVTAGTTMTAPATFSPPASSGATVGSIAPAPSTFAPTPSSGATIGSLVAVPATFSPLSSSGVVIGEIASTVATFETDGASGVSIGSYNSPGNTYTNSGSAGVNLGTVAMVGVVFPESGSSGIALASPPDSSTTFGPTGSAGVAVGTYASASIVFLASGSAGISIWSEAFDSSVEIVSGGIGYGGSATELFIQHWVSLPFYPSPVTATVFSTVTSSSSASVSSGGPDASQATVVKVGISAWNATVKPKGE